MKIPAQSASDRKVNLGQPELFSSGADLNRADNRLSSATQYGKCLRQKSRF